MAEFAGKVVAVTGAAGSLGRSVGARFAGAGARLLLLDREQAAVDALGAELGAGHEARGVDLTSRERTAEAIAGGAKSLGRIDVLCNIAGGFAMGPPVHALPADHWRQMFEINVATLLNAVAAVVPLMLAAGRGGKIVNVGALSAATGKAHMAAYIAAKSTVSRITESMAAELRDSGINVNCVLPSIIDTPPNRASMPKADFSRWVEPAALADVVAFLASDRARAVHGASIPVAGLS
jgi:NAD(P)-dependent dehydrogenase (short-subunit alcohol dehydrogenase family)